MSLSHGLLGLLDYSDMTGYKLAQTFHDSLRFFWQAQTSQIYRELNKMEEKGFLSSRIELQTDRPNKRIYSITAAGKTELKDWLESEMSEETILTPTRSEMLLRLFFSSQRTKEENIAELKRIREAYQNKVAALSSVAQSIHEYQTFAHSGEDMIYWNFTADFGRSYSKMCLEWVEKCIQKLEGNQ